MPASGPAWARQTTDQHVEISFRCWGWFRPISTPPRTRLPAALVVADLGVRWLDTALDCLQASKAVSSHRTPKRNCPTTANGLVKTPPIVTTGNGPANEFRVVRG